MAKENRPKIIIENPGEGEINKTILTVESPFISEVSAQIAEKIIGLLFVYGIDVVVEEKSEKVFVPTEIESDGQSKAMLATMRAMGSKKTQ